MTHLKAHVNILKTSFFPQDIVAGFTEINNGVDEKLTNGLNFNLSEPFEFNVSKKILAEHLRRKVEYLKIPHQVHGKNVVVVDRNTNTEIIDADGLITQDVEVVLGSTSADCAVMLMFDPVQKVIASVHSGRKGTEQNIAEATITKMTESFHCRPEHLLVSLQPSANVENYEVDDKTASSWPAEFVETFPSVDQNGQKKNFNSYHLNIKARIAWQLKKAGVKAENIEISNICTITNVRFHSYRREGKAHFKTNLGFIGL